MDKPQSFEEVFKDAYDYWIDDANIHRYEGAKGLADQVWQHQQAKVEELQKRVDAALEQVQGNLKYVEQDRRENFEFLQMAMIRAFKELEQALKGENNEF
ncbi:hypothetical protein [Acinetobacter pittii]|uniref:hypothetical protein n=1 Tax=Acinetobacter pittii TaxID=48296 RepID=UPI003009364B